MPAERRDAQKSPELQPAQRAVFTEPLATSFLDAANNGQDPIELPDLLLKLLASDNKASKLIRTLTADKFTQLQDQLLALPLDGTIAAEGTFQNISAQYGADLIRVIEDAQARIAVGNPIATDHIILADLTSANSQLADLFETLGVNVLGFGAKGVDTRSNFVMEVARRLDGEEEGAVDFIYTATDQPSTIRQSRETDQNEVRQPRKPEKPPAYDLVKHFKDGSVEQPYIRNKWVMELLHGIENSSMSVIVSDQKDEADAIVAGLAKQFAGDNGSVFPYRSIITVEATALETNPLHTIRQAVNAADGGILYLPDIHRYLKSQTGSDEISREIRAALARKSIKVVSTLTEKQYHKVYEQDEFSRASILMPDPATIAEAQEILMANKAALERELSSSGVPITIPPETIKEAVQLADRYYREQNLPGSAATIIKRAATEIKAQFAHMAAAQMPTEITESQIDPHDVADALERMTGIKISKKDKEKYLKMDEELKQSIVGQDEAIQVVCSAIRRSRAELNDPKRPLGSFLFLGPSGVGKTELTKKLAEFLFDDEDEVIQLNMSEYMEKHRVSQLIGAPPGYEGYEEGGQLTEKVRKKPYSVILFDEIEKAHPDVWNMFLQIMEEGSLTDGHGRNVDFKNTVIVMTGNVGSEYYRTVPEALEGKASEADITAEIKKRVDEEMKRTFRPEFLNRVDEIIAFNSLKPEHIETIVGIQAGKVNKKLEKQGLKIEVTPKAQKYIAEKSYQPEYGARPVKREIRRQIEDPLAIELLADKFISGDSILVDVDDNGKMVFAKAGNGLQ